MRVNNLTFSPLSIFKLQGRMVQTDRETDKGTNEKHCLMLF